MSLGFSISNAAGTVLFSTDSMLYRVIGYGVISFGTNEITTKSLTIPTALAGDVVIVTHVTATLAQIGITRPSSTTCSIQRYSVLLGLPSSYVVIFVRGA